MFLKQIQHLLWTLLVWGEVDQAAIDAVNEELNFPSLQKLRRVLDQRGIAYNKKTLNV